MQARRKLELLIDQHGGRALRLAMALCGNRADAEDIVGGALVTAARKARDLPEASALWSWFAGVIVNESRNYRRREQRRSMPDIPEAPIDSSALQPAESASSSEEYARLHVAMNELAADEREALSLTHVDGLTHREAGEALGISHTAIRKRVQRGLESLRRRLGGDERAVVNCLGSLPLLSASDALKTQWKAEIANVMAQESGAAIVASSGSSKLSVIAFVSVAVALAIGVSIYLLVGIAAGKNAPNEEGIESAFARHSEGIATKITTTSNAFENDASAKTKNRSGEVAADDEQPESNTTAQGDPTHSLPESVALEDLGDIALTPVTMTLRGRIVDLAGNPIPNAEVSIGGRHHVRVLRSDPGAPSALIQAGYPGASGASDANADGSFTQFVRAGLPDLSGARLSLRVQVTLECRAPDYAPLLRKVEVRDKRELDFGDLRLEPADSLVGLVTDAQGRPIAGAEIYIREKYDGMTWGEPEIDPHVQTPNTTTDQSGVFTLSDRKHGNYVVGVFAEGFAPEIRVIRHSKGTSDRGRFQLARGGALTGTLAIPETPAGFEGQLTTIMGGKKVERVVAALPSNDPAVELYGENDINSLIRRSIFRCLPDADGRYNLRQLPAGKYIFCAFAHGFFTQKQHVEVFANQTRTVDLSFEAAGVIHGKITGRDGVGLAGERVFLGTGGTIGFNPDVGERLETRTDASGFYRFPFVPPGEWTVLLERDLTIVYSGPLQSTRLQFLDPEETIEVNINLAERTGTTVSGRVTIDGEAAFRRFMLNSSEQHTQLGADIDAEGKFEIEFVPAGSYTYVFCAGGYPQDDEVIYSADLTIEESDQRKTLNVDLQSVSLTGVIRDTSGESQSGKSVVVQRLSDKGQSSWFTHGITVVSDSEGAFRFPHLLPGEFNVKVYAEGAVPIEERVVLREDTKLDLTLITQAAGLLVAIDAIVGEDSAGPPPAMTYAHYSLKNNDDEFISFVHSGQVTQWAHLDQLSSTMAPTHIGGIAPGSYTLQITGRHIESADFPVSVVAGQNKLMSLTLYRSSSVVVLLRAADDADTNGLKGAWIKVKLPGLDTERSWSAYNAILDEQGRLQVTCHGLVPGTLSFNVSRSGFKSETIDVVVPRATRVVQEFVLERE